ncbi:MAG: iron-sulfur cluster biosynthesis protein [Sciscionella sp.]
MLALTSTALEVVKAITTVEGAPEGAGLRIATAKEDTQEDGLEISVTAAPAADDQVLTGEDGGVIFLEPQAASFLDDKVLDAQVDDNGQASFALGDQAPENDAAPQQ